MADTAITTILPGTQALYAAEEPDRIIGQAVARANALAKVIEGKHLYTEISGKKHVHVEGWTMLATLHNLSPVVVWSKRLAIGDGWEARVEVYSLDGGLRGAAECHCDRSEAKWADRDDHAIRSMAETRATAKALRLPLGYVIALAGYEPTPMEEMPDDNKPKHGGINWCSEHQTVWFQKGQMKSFAHPIGDTGKWCHRPKAAESPKSQRPPEDGIIDMSAPKSPPVSEWGSPVTEPPEDLGQAFPTEPATNITPNDLIDLAKKAGWTSAVLLNRMRLDFMEPGLSLPNFTPEQRLATAEKIQHIIADKKLAEAV